MDLCVNKMIADSDKSFMSNQINRKFFVEDLCVNKLTAYSNGRFMNDKINCGF